VTTPELIAAGVRASIGNAALIKANQIGTVSETLDALRVCRASGYSAMISHRSGETDDSLIADLAVASGGTVTLIELFCSAVCFSDIAMDQCGIAGVSAAISS